MEPGNGTPDSGVKERLQSLQNRMCGLEAEHGRDVRSTHLLAVSKRHPVDRIREAYAAGQRLFGENFVQEALAKQRELGDCAIEWHFIGAIQSNKSADIARHFSWVHTLASAKVARRLSAARPPELAPLNILIQINISGESSKQGIEAADAPELVRLVSQLPQLRYRGLMTLPALAESEAEQRHAFSALRELAIAMPAPFDTLSMGTSHDYAAAIAEGSTMVRLGTAIFGPRPMK